MIQPGDALYVEYRGEPFDLTAHLANGDVIGFDSASKARPDQWRKGIYPLDMFGRNLNQKLVGLTATAKNPAQVSLRNIRIVRAGKPVFEFVELISYGRPEVKTISTRRLPCRGNDEYPNVAVAYAEANRFAATGEFSTPVPARETPGTPAPAPLTLTAQQINSLVLHNAPPIQAGDNLLMRVNRTDFSLEIVLTHQKNIMNVHPPEGTQPKNGWIGGRIKLDRPGIIGERIVGMKVKQIAPGGAPLLFRTIQLEREGRVILALASRPEQKPENSGFDPPMSYPPDPMIPNPHVANASLSRSDLLRHQPDTGFLAPKLPSYSISPMLFQSTTSTGDPNHYKFQGKELDAETGLYNFGARFYNPALSRFMSPDWSRGPAPVPYANFANPQSLNLYSFGLNNPMSMRDSDGHCPGDDCSKVKVTVTADTPSLLLNVPVKKADGSPGYVSGAGTVTTVTFQSNGKPMAGVDVKESPTTKDNLSNSSVPNQANPATKATSDAGTIHDVVMGVITPNTSQPQNFSTDDKAGMTQVTTTEPYNRTTDQTLTFSVNGQTCQCTYSETLSNANSSGNLNKSTNPDGTNMKFSHTDPVVQRVKDKDQK
ncbi:MAG TPA: RHS repeat-associated core domain-containing protein [Candidatus Angelobacter sp.]